MADLYGTTAAPASWFADTLDPSVPPAGATMPVMPKRGFWGELGDALAGLGGVNAPAIRQANFDATTAANAQYNHVTAQTQQALEGAYLDREKRMSESAKRENEAADRASGQAFWQQLTDAQANDPSYVPPVSDMGTAYANNPKALLDTQEALYKSGMASGTTPQDQRFRYGEAIKGEVRPQLYDVGGETVNMATDPNATFQTPAQHATVLATQALEGERNRSPAGVAAAQNATPPVDADYQNAVAELMGAKPSYGMGAAGQAARQRALAIKAHLLSDQSYVPPGVTPGMNFANASDAVNNINRFKLSGNPTLARRVATLDAIPSLLDNLQESANQVGLSDFKPLASVQLAWRNATNDPALRSYLTQRQDVLFQIAGALRSSGNTVAADKLESEAQGGTSVSPEGLKGFVQGVLKSTGATRDILHGVMTPHTGAPAAASDTPSGWTKQTSPSTGAVRWINKATGETRNTAP